MRNLLILLICLACSGNISYAQDEKPGSEGTQKSLAIILKLEGYGNRIDKMEVYKADIYPGVAKNLNSVVPSNAAHVLKIQVVDDKDAVVYEGFYENPLNHHLESFEENGVVNYNIIPENSGFLNIRFPLRENSSSITTNCYLHKKDGDILLATVGSPGTELEFAL